jgi:hypothetical protein
LNLNPFILKFFRRENEGFVREFPKLILDKLIQNINIMKKKNFSSNELDRRVLDGAYEEGDSQLKTSEREKLERQLFEKELLEVLN